MFYFSAILLLFLCKFANISGFSSLMWASEDMVYIGDKVSLYCMVSYKSFSSQTNTIKNVTINWSGNKNNYIRKDTILNESRQSVVTYTNLELGHTGVYRCIVQIDHFFMVLSTLVTVIHKNHSAIRKVGQPCHPDEHICIQQNSKCEKSSKESNDYTCKCDASHPNFHVAHDEGCFEAKRIGDNCTFNLECERRDHLSLCNNGKCTCRKDHSEDPAFKSCLPTSKDVLRFPCTSSGPCKTAKNQEVYHSICENLVCKCLDGFKPDAKRVSCIPIDSALTPLEIFCIVAIGLIIASVLGVAIGVFPSYRDRISGVINKKNPASSGITAGFY